MPASIAQDQPPPAAVDDPAAIVEAYLTAHMIPDPVAAKPSSRPISTSRSRAGAG